MRAVELAVAGEQTLDIMRMIGRSRGFVQRWCYAYRDGGLDAVVAKSPPGRSPRLPTTQHAAFKQRVLAGPDENDGVCAFRGRDCIAILEAEFGVKYSLSAVYDLLHRIDLEPLAPRPQHRHSDPEAMREWVEDAPFLSATCNKNTRANASKSGSKTKRESDNKGR